LQADRIHRYSISAFGGKADALEGRRFHLELANPPGRCSLLPEEKLDDPARLRESLRDLLALDFDCLLVGDGTPILEGAKAQLEDLVASFQA